MSCRSNAVADVAIQSQVDVRNLGSWIKQSYQMDSQEYISQSQCRVRKIYPSFELLNCGRMPICTFPRRLRCNRYSNVLKRPL